MADSNAGMCRNIRHVKRKEAPGILYHDQWVTTDDEGRAFGVE
jgi:hypothetical protein